MFKIVVGGIIKKDNKYLLIQEKKEQAYGKWSSPSGRLEPNEDIFVGTKREIKEESGLDVELVGLININNIVDEKNTIVIFNFNTEVIGGEIKIKEDEVLAVEWFTYEEINNMKDKLRRPDLLLPTLELLEQGNVKELDNIKIMR